MEVDVTKLPEEPQKTVIWTANGKRLIKILSFFLILTVGLLLRFDTLIDWLEKPELALYQGEPILTTFDGYYYLSLARDLMEGRYAAIDEMRAVPDLRPRPFPPPLMSIMAAGIATVTPLSLNWVAVILPAFLGVLLAFPLYGLGKHYGGAFMGLSAALVSLVSPYYILRSGIGWFDTDCFLVTLVVTATWCFLKFGVILERSRYLYLAAGLITSLVTLWWWDQAPHIAMLLTIAPLGVALVFHFRPKYREWRWFVLPTVLYSIILIAWQGWQFPLEIISDITSKFAYVSKQSTGLFPNIGVTISEQSKMPVMDIVLASLGNPLILLLAIAGLIWLLIKHPKDSLFLAVPVGLAIAATLFAGRFLIYVAPAAGLGIGYLASQIWKLGNGKPLMIFLAPTLVLASVIPGYQSMMSTPRFPHEPPVVIEGMDVARQQTEKDAVLWAWWDHGYPINYWARRATVNDGQVHGGERSVYNGLPLVTSSERLSANFMQFYVVQGLPGVRKFYGAIDDPVRGYELLLKVLHLGPENGAKVLINAGIDDVNHWLAFLFPEQSRPVYLFLDWRLTQISYWWYWLGSWDNATLEGVHPYHRTILGVVEKNDWLLAPGLEINLIEGVVKLGDEELPISSYNSSGLPADRKDYPAEDGVNVDYSKEKHMVVISDGFFNASVFNRLFTHSDARTQSTWLEIVEDQSPAYQIIRVNGDTYRPEDDS